MEEDDATLLDRWCTGDQVAGTCLFRRHYSAIYRFFEHNTDGEVEDLVQETFLACMSSRDKFRRHSSFRTYLFAIARNMLFEYWRRRRASRTTVDIQDISVAALTTSIGSRLARREDRAALLAALRELSLDHQILLEMFYWEDIEREQLAEVFGVEAATIGSRLFRARKELRSKLAADGLQKGTDGDDESFDDWARKLGR